jgi:hypothetical protein
MFGVLNAASASILCSASSRCSRPGRLPPLRFARPAPGRSAPRRLKDRLASDRARVPSYSFHPRAGGWGRLCLPSRRREPHRQAHPAVPSDQSRCPVPFAAGESSEQQRTDARRVNYFLGQLSGKFSGIKVAYLGTQRDLGVILEIFSGLPDVKQKPDAT